VENFARAIDSFMLAGHQVVVTLEKLGCDEPLLQLLGNSVGNVPLGLAVKDFCSSKVFCQPSHPSFKYGLPLITMNMRYNVPQLRLHIPLHSLLSTWPSKNSPS
jgi:hypothetical protein